MTHKQMYQLLYLERLCKLYARFMTYYNSVHVYEVEGVVYIRWFKKINIKDGNGVDREYENFTMRQFPVSHLAKRIVSYKNKIRREFKNRHNE